MSVSSNIFLQSTRQQREQRPPTNQICLFFFFLFFFIGSFFLKNIVFLKWTDSLLGALVPVDTFPKRHPRDFLNIVQHESGRWGALT